MAVEFKVRRENCREFPLIEWMYFTGEAENPYRCECCLTAKQRKQAIYVPVFASWEIPYPRPACCRKCGCDY